MNETDKSFWLESKLLWLFLILMSLAMEGVALYYQHILEEPPCSLCIHFRLLLILVILIAILGLIFRRNSVGRILASLALLGVSVIMAERAYILLGTERVFLTGECSFDLGLPAWFAVDKWIPWLFAPETTCGYTPYLLFGITMAEALTVFSAVMISGSFWMLISSFRQR